MGKKNKKVKKKSKGQLKREAAQAAKLEAQAKEHAERKRQESIARGEDPEEEAKKKKDAEEKAQAAEEEEFTMVGADDLDVKEFTRDLKCDQITVAPIGGGTALIHKSNLKLTHGHRYGLIGKNGAGKTTLLRHIAEKNFRGIPEYLRVHLVQQEMEGSDMTVMEAVKASDIELTRLINEKERLLEILDLPEHILAEEIRQYKIENGYELDAEEEAAEEEAATTPSPEKKKAKAKPVAKEVTEETIQQPSKYVTINMSPGRLGIVGKWDEGLISKICDDVHEDLRGKAKKGWVFHTINNEPFDLQLLKKFSTGRFKYELTFKTGADPEPEVIQPKPEAVEKPKPVVEKKKKKKAKKKKTKFEMPADFPISERRQKAIDASEKIDPMRLVFIDERLTILDADQAEKRASEVLDGLQFTDRMKNMKTADLSGGWRMRVSLACGLFIEPDVLLLDEPTNHLDFPSVMWLTEYLAFYNPDKSLVIVSHDRSFMDEVTSDIIHLDKCKLVYYKGNYAQFKTTRDELRRHQATQYKKQQREIAHQEDFIRRFAANKKWSTQAQSRRKLLQKMVRVEKVDNEQNWSFSFPDPPPLRNNRLLDVEDMSFGYFGHDETEKSYLLRNVDCRLDCGTKIGCIGANGAGKSTLLKLIMKELQPIEGKCYMKNEVTHGYFAQHHMDTIDMEATPLQFLRHEFENTSLQECYAKLGRFNISPKHAKKPIATLSGGEKSRLAFAILTWYQPHLVIMDEPTNHLDIQTQDSLVNALKEFKGSLLIVSHDKHLLTEVCDEFWVVGNRGLRKFENFDKATNYCYKKCKPVDVLPREFSTIEKKKKKAIPKRAKESSAEEVLAATPIVAGEDIFIIDCERELQKGIKKGLPPSKILMHLRGWTPIDGIQSAINIYVFQMYQRFFAHPELADVDIFDYMEEQAPLVKFLIPEDHIENQSNFCKISQSCWHTCKLEGSQKALEPEMLETLFECIFQFGYVTKAGFEKWYHLTDDFTAGREECIGLLENWFAEIFAPEEGNAPEDAPQLMMEAVEIVHDGGTNI